jgi:hypothetical protein
MRVFVSARVDFVQWEVAALLYCHVALNSAIEDGKPFQGNHLVRPRRLQVHVSNHAITDRVYRHLPWLAPPPCVLRTRNATMGENGRNEGFSSGQARFSLAAAAQLTRNQLE